MIDLYLFCGDLKDPCSSCGRTSAAIIAEFHGFLKSPSPKIAALLALWREDFRYVYGDVSAGLSGNARVDAAALLGRYGLPASGDGGDAGDLQLLFFSIQTYFSALVKYIMADALDPAGGWDAAGVLLGGFARARGIENYCCADWYCWPLFALEDGCAAVLERIRRHLADFRSPPGEAPPAAGGHDCIKQIYETLVPAELRHALGEYYTPDWLAEIALERALAACGAERTAQVRIMDPTCGSGTFLVQGIAAKRRAGCGLAEILDTVCGLDVNPLAVLTAKTNYLLSVLDLLDGGTAVVLPVFRGDVLRLGESVDVQEAPDFLSGEDPAAAVRALFRREALWAQQLGEMDVIAGNPPWVNWEYLPEAGRAASRQLWVDYGLFSARGRARSFAKEDISVLITYAAMDRLLRRGGVLSFLLRRGVFKSAQNGAGFRRFRIGDREDVQVLRVDDLGGVPAFDAAAPAAIFLARKGGQTEYPVPYCLWEKRAGTRRSAFAPCASAREVLEQVTVVPQCALPSVEGDPASPWLTVPREGLTALERVRGTNGYRARTGVFTGGANAVYWLQIQSAGEDTVTVTNVVDRAKRKVERVTAELEREYIFPMLKGGNIRRWRTSYDTYLLCPHTARSRMRPVPIEVLRQQAPNTCAYLRRFRDVLDSRGGFAGWEKDLQRRDFHVVLRVGAYTFAPYKVVWKYIASSFVCAVVGSVDDPYLGRKLLLPNEKVMYIGCEDEAEAFYICGLLSSTPVARYVQGFMSPTSISAHVLDKLNIPAFDPADRVHAAIAELCRRGHGGEDVEECIAGIDALAAEIYGCASEE